MIRLRASALNHLDVWIRKGLPSVPKPRILGADGAGVVESLGEGVTGFDPGSAVVINPGVEAADGAIHVIGEHGDGTNAQLIAVPATNVYPIPDGLSFEEAAAFPLVFETAYRMLVTRARLQAGEWVLLWGIGSGVSTAGARDREGARRANDRDVVERREARAGARARRGRDGEPCDGDVKAARQGGDRRARRRRRRRPRRRGDVAHVARRRRARGAHRRLRRDERARTRPRRCTGSGGSS